MSAVSHWASTTRIGWRLRAYICIMISLWNGCINTCDCGLLVLKLLELCRSVKDDALKVVDDFNIPSCCIQAPIAGVPNPRAEWAFYSQPQYLSKLWARDPGFMRIWKAIEWFQVAGLIGLKQLCMFGWESKGLRTVDQCTGRFVIKDHVLCQKSSAKGLNDTFSCPFNNVCVWKREF